MLKVGNNAIGRIIMRKEWGYFPTKQGVPVARKGYTSEQKSYVVSTYTKKGVWCHV